MSSERILYPSPRGIEKRRRAHRRTRTAPPRGRECVLVSRGLAKRRERRVHGADPVLLLGRRSQDERCADDQRGTRPLCPIEPFTEQDPREQERAERLEGAEEGRRLRPDPLQPGHEKDEAEDGRRENDPEEDRKSVS